MREKIFQVRIGLLRLAVTGRPYLLTLSEYKVEVVLDYANGK